MRIFLNVLLWLVVLFHMAVTVAAGYGAILMIFTSPWYISLLVTILLINLVFSPNISCPVTMIENRLRVALGYEPVDRFLEKYLFLPIRRIRGDKS